MNTLTNNDLENWATSPEFAGTGVQEMASRLLASETRVVELEQRCEIDPRTHQLIDMKERVAELEAQLASLPADWSKDSSLETWFPLSAEHIDRLEAQLAERRGQDNSPFAWATLRDGDQAFPKLHKLEEQADYWVNYCNLNPPVRKIKLYDHPVPPAASLPSYRDGIEAAAKWIDQQREAFDNAHGRHDPDTGTFEFGNDAQLEHSSTLAELSEGIRALQPSAASQPYTVPTFDEWCQRNNQKPLGWVRDAMRESYEGCRAAMIQSSLLADMDAAAHRAAMLQSANSPVIPDGWVIVPNKPTQSMIDVGLKSMDVAEIYQDMLAAAPQHKGE
ncbi:hypothetical protein [Pectobacterium brasiliense]|uniref:hypothetical protein n=1 Tax=Pectobacterium brasiliense TaxID=180957 RepID=UPI0025A018FF|nr:hypothetical protein [Pectobacterium brasiliense]WJM80546.1 hypothetical protein QTI90_20135 [Pectobacterium brasiliense]